MSDSSNEHQTAHSGGIHAASDHPSNEILGTAPACPKGTMVILLPERSKAEAPKPESISVDSSSRSRSSARAAMVVSAAAIGGLAGSLATAGISHLTMLVAEMPSHYSALAEALGRIDHELMAFKSATQSATNATDAQLAEIVGRMDRTEKAVSEAGARSSKAADSTDRTERRVAAAAGDVTGTVADSRASIAAAHPAAADAKQPSPTRIVDGWVVRDVYRGAALIQGRGGVIEVLPGDNLPGLGWIQQVKRQDGRWVVVTSRGQIVSR
jgi:hypothetical protein